MGRGRGGGSKKGDHMKFDFEPNVKALKKLKTVSTTVNQEIFEKIQEIQHQKKCTLSEVFKNMILFALQNMKD